MQVQVTLYCIHNNNYWLINRYDGLECNGHNGFNTNNNFYSIRDTIVPICVTQLITAKYFTDSLSRKNLEGNTDL